MPPAEVAVHPSDSADPAQELYLMCDDRVGIYEPRHPLATELVQE